MKTAKTFFSTCGDKDGDTCKFQLVRISTRQMDLMIDVKPFPFILIEVIHKSLYGGSDDHGIIITAMMMIEIDKRKYNYVYEPYVMDGINKVVSSIPTITKEHGQEIRYKPYMLAIPHPDASVIITKITSPDGKILGWLNDPILHYKCERLITHNITRPVQIKNLYNNGNNNVRVNSYGRCDSQSGRLVLTKLFSNLQLVTVNRNKQEVENEVHNFGPDETSATIIITKLDGNVILTKTFTFIKDVFTRPIGTKVSYVMKDPTQNIDFDTNHIEPWHFNISLRSKIQMNADFDFIKI